MVKEISEVIKAVEKTIAQIGIEGIAIKKELLDEHMVYRITISKGDKEKEIGLPKNLVDDYLDSGDRSIEWMRLIKTTVRKL